MAPNIINSCNPNLKYRTMFIAILQSILSFIFLVITADCAGHPDDWFNTSDPSIPNKDILRIILITLPVASAVVCVVSLLLIFAAATNRPLLFLPWLILNPIAVVIYVVIYLTIAVCAIQITVDNNGMYLIGHSIVAISILLIALYKIVTVYVFYKHLKSLNF